MQPNYPLRGRHWPTFRRPPRRAKAQLNGISDMWPTLGDTTRIRLITRRSRVAGSPPQRVAGFDRRIRRLGPETPRPVPSLPRSGWSDQTLSGALARYNRLMVNTVLTVGIITSNRELRRTIKQITRNGVETAPGSSDWFTGTVFIDTVAAPSNGSRLSASSVHFTPRSRTAWHTHPNVKGALTRFHP